MERILIIGCSGAGKSTLARALGKKLDLPITHLDQLWWEPGWEHITREEFDKRLNSVLWERRWIIDGNYSRTIQQRLSRCDTILYLDFNRWSCLWGMAQRVLGSYGKVRPDMSPGCPERFDWEFIKFIWNFNKNNRVRNYTYLAQAKHARCVVLKNRKEVQAFLDQIEQADS